MHSEVKGFVIIVFVDVAIWKDFAFLVYFPQHATTLDQAFEKAL